MRLERRVARTCKASLRSELGLSFVVRPHDRHFRTLSVPAGRGGGNWGLVACGSAAWRGAVGDRNPSDAAELAELPDTPNQASLCLTSP